MKATVLSLLFLCCTLAWSQAEPAHSKSTMSGDVFGGYLYSAGNSSQSGSGFLAGGDIDRVFKGVGFTGEFGLTRASSPPSPVNPISEFNVLVGPRFVVPLSRTSRIVPFLDGLVGTNTLHNSGQQYTWQFDNHTSFAWAFDGGLDFSLTKHLALRGQGGYLGNSLAGSTYGGPAGRTHAGRARVSVGAVIRF